MQENNSLLMLILYLFIQLGFIVEKISPWKLEV